MEKEEQQEELSSSFAKLVKDEWEEHTPADTQNTNAWCRTCRFKSNCYTGKHALVVCCSYRDEEKGGRKRTKSVPESNEGGCRENKESPKGEIRGNPQTGDRLSSYGRCRLFFASTQGGKHERGNNHSPLCTWNHVGIRRGLHLIKSAFQ